MAQKISDNGFDMNANCTKWIVTVPNQYSNDPRAAQIMCVVNIKTEKEFDDFNDILIKEHLHAFKEKSYKRYFFADRIGKNSGIAKDFVEPKVITFPMFKTMKRRTW